MAEPSMAMAMEQEFIPIGHGVDEAHRAPKPDRKPKHRRIQVRKMTRCQEFRQSRKVWGVTMACLAVVLAATLYQLWVQVQLTKQDKAAKDARCDLEPLRAKINDNQESKLSIGNCTRDWLPDGNSSCFLSCKDGWLLLELSVNHAEVTCDNKILKNKALLGEQDDEDLKGNRHCLAKNDSCWVKKNVSHVPRPEYYRILSSHLEEHTLVPKYVVRYHSERETRRHRLSNEHLKPCYCQFAKPNCTFYWTPDMRAEFKFCDETQRTRRGDAAIKKVSFTLAKGAAGGKNALTDAVHNEDWYCVDLSFRKTDCPKIALTSDPTVFNVVLVTKIDDEKYERSLAAISSVQVDVPGQDGVDAGVHVVERREFCQSLETEDSALMSTLNDFEGMYMKYSESVATVDDKMEEQMSKLPHVMFAERT